METEHEEVVARLEASKTAMQATVEAAAAYREALVRWRSGGIVLSPALCVEPHTHTRYQLLTQSAHLLDPNSARRT